jgi:hypothetical protein
MENFHDGHFDGIYLETTKIVHIFLRNGNKARFILVLKGVEAISLSEIRAGNIILDIAIRSSSTATSSDVQELYDVDENTDYCAKLLASTREKRLQILELNSSYGASGLFLFDSFEIKEATERTASALPSVEAKN